MTKFAYFLFAEDEENFKDNRSRRMWVFQFAGLCVRLRGIQG